MSTRKEQPMGFKAAIAAVEQADRDRALVAILGVKDALQVAQVMRTHTCRKCQGHVGDMAYIAAGLFMSLCPQCLASALHTARRLA